MTPATRTAALLAGVVAVMAAGSFAAVPFYSWFCKVTGYGGTTGEAQVAPGTILNRTIRINFDASLERGMPWEFKPAQVSMDLRIGEAGMAFYEAFNPTDRVVAGTATFNVTPDAAGGYFDKIACFCFTEQVLRPGERVQMPVTFFVDPAIVADPEGRFVREITLSYTFHETPVPGEQAALSVPRAAIVN